MGFNVVTITGASGFVGRNIQDYLNVSYRIKPLMFVTYLTKKLIWKVTPFILLESPWYEKKVSNPSEYYESNFELTNKYLILLQSEASIFYLMSTVKL
jgi:hypothetical protein